MPRALTALAILGTVDRLSTFSQRIKTSLCGIHPGFKADGPIMYYDIAFCQLRAAIRFDDDRVSLKQGIAFRIGLYEIPMEYFIIDINIFLIKYIIKSEKTHPSFND